MFAYQIRLAFRSLRRNPWLSALTIGGIALGIAVAMIFTTAYYFMAANPIPSKSDDLYYVQLDFWNPERPWDDDDPTEPPNQLTYNDMMAMMASDVPTHKTGMYKAELTIHPAEDRPYRAITRMTFADFFPMFDVPFRYGGGWDRAADEGPEQVIVLSHETNQQLFGGENSVGRDVRIEDRDFRVIGVMAPWRPLPKFYDTHNGEFQLAESVFMPFHFSREMEIDSAGNDSGWKGYDGDEYENFLNSESTWLQMWVQLDTRAQKAEFEDYVQAYHAEQAALGRPGRPQNAKLRDVMAWLKFEQVVPDEARAMLIIALLFLLVCSVNLIGILLGKFMARSSEVGVRRALGASRRWVFVQHLIECEVIGIIGGVLGLGLSFLGLKLVAKLFQDNLNFTPDYVMFGVAVLLSLVSAMIAGIYPAWRICRIQPGLHLKTQ